jgi:hypothetical protein
MKSWRCRNSAPFCDECILSRILASGRRRWGVLIQCPFLRIRLTLKWIAQRLSLCARYLVTSTNGGVLGCGDATPLGGVTALHLLEPIVGIAATPDNHSKQRYRMH